MANIDAKYAINLTDKAKPTIIAELKNKVFSVDADGDENYDFKKYLSN